jgi:hypothetical protein
LQDHPLCHHLFRTRPPDEVQAGRQAPAICSLAVPFQIVDAGIQLFRKQGVEAAPLEVKYFEAN